MARRQGIYVFLHDGPQTGCATKCCFEKCYSPNKEKDVDEDTLRLLIGNGAEQDEENPCRRLRPLPPLLEQLADKARSPSLRVCGSLTSLLLVDLLDLAQSISKADKDDKIDMLDNSIENLLQHLIESRFDGGRYGDVHHDGDAVFEPTHQGGDTVFDGSAQSAFSTTKLRGAFDRREGGGDASSYLQGATKFNGQQLSTMKYAGHGSRARILSKVDFDRHIARGLKLEGILEGNYNRGSGRGGRKGIGVSSRLVLIYE